MELDAQSRMILDGMNRSGVLPFSQFSALEARDQILKLRVNRAPNPSHDMWKVLEESIHSPDGDFNIRILQPRPLKSDELMPAVLYFHGGGFFAAASMKLIRSSGRLRSNPMSSFLTWSITSRLRPNFLPPSTMRMRRFAGSPTMRPDFMSIPTVSSSPVIAQAACSRL